MENNIMWIHYSTMKMWSFLLMLSCWRHCQMLDLVILSWWRNIWLRMIVFLMDYWILVTSYLLGPVIDESSFGNMLSLQSKVIYCWIIGFLYQKYIVRCNEEITAAPSVYTLSYNLNVSKDVPDIVSNIYTPVHETHLF